MSNYKENTTSNIEFIYGKNAVAEALRNRADTIERVFMEKDRTFDDEYEKEVLSLVKKNNLKLEKFSPNDLAKELKFANHQGILAKVNINSLTVSFEHFIENLQVDPNTCLLILGELQDPQNVGSIIRSAAAFGVAGILIPEHDQVQINATVVKVSAGAAFSIPLVRINNVNNCIEKLKEKRFWIYGLDMEGEKFISEESFTEPSVFVIGNEGDGIRQKTKETCDMVLKIPQSEKVESLNASISTAVALYEWRRQKITN